MKALFLNFITTIAEFVLRKVLSKLGNGTVYTYRKLSDGQYEVGYWSHEGNFISKAKVPSIEEAKSLTLALNRK